MGNADFEQKNQKPVIFISMSLAWCVRNFFQTGIVRQLARDCSVVVITTSKIKKIIDDQQLGDGLFFEVRDGLTEPFLWRLLREFKKKIYMEGRSCSTETLWENYKKRPFYQVVGGKVIKKLIRIFNAKKILSSVDKIDQWMNRDHVFGELYKRYEPQLLFSTHASTYFEESLFRCAKRFHVPSVLMLLSWDHVSSKIVLSRGFEKILVWNEIMRSEILETYSYYRESQIKVVGIPQYDIYTMPPKKTYAEWCQQYGMDPTKRTIVFYTMPQVRHCDQHLILEQIVAATEQGRIRANDVQVLIKHHPFDDMGVYSELHKRRGVGVCKTTLESGQGQESWYPTQDELERSRDCLFYAAVTINIFSTVTLEATIFDKPIVHVGYDVREVRNRIPCREYYNFAHFKAIMDYQASVLVQTEQELVNAINFYLENPRWHSGARKDLVWQYCGVVDGQSSLRVVKEIQQSVFNQQ